MSALIDRYWTHYGSQEAFGRAGRKAFWRASAIRAGPAVSFGRLTAWPYRRWYENLTGVRELSPGTAVRHFNVMHHMMEKASTIWSKETGIDRNPADQVEVKRPDDQRDRYLSEDELRQAQASARRKEVPQGYESDQQDVLPSEADCADRRYDRDASVRDLRL